MIDSSQHATPLARLSFWMPPSHLDDLAAIYDRQLTPVSQERGLNHSSPIDRPPFTGVFSMVERAGNGSIRLDETGS